MFGVTSAITAYGTRICWICAVYKEQQPSADCAGKSLYVLTSGLDFKSHATIGARC